MGSGSSRLGWRSSRPRVIRRKPRLPSFICGRSPSLLPTHHMEDNLAEVLVASNCSTKESPLIVSSENDTNSINVNISSQQSGSSTVGEILTQNGSVSSQTSHMGKFLFESKELVPSESNIGEIMADSFWDRTTDTASTSKEFQPLESQEEIGESSTENDTNEGLIASHNSSSNSVMDSSTNWHLLRGDESAREASPSSPVASLHQRNLLHVDVVSISSSILASSTSGEVSSREGRRNSRRLFWDAFSRRSSGRHTGSPSIAFSTEHTDDLVGSDDRWLLGFNGDILNGRFGDDSGYLSNRSRAMYARRRNSRSELWERLRGSFDENNSRTTFCSSGLHPDGTCTCEPFLMAEESGTRASISRIVMLAEALFEVLDEIHRQPVSFSLAMVSVPAPEAVVDSFPLKSHKKPVVVENGDDVEQCYICLVEYEVGDKIRTLPCRHEYHMTCVDKWLKEIHGVCPLCRGDVCQTAAEA